MVGRLQQDGLHTAAEGDPGLADGPVGFTNIKKGLHYAAKFVSREHALSLLDQGIVSATGFLSTLMIAHWADASQLGIYALGLSVLVSVVAFQESLILQPYTIQRFHPEEAATVQAGASLMLSAFFSAGNVLILMVAASVLTWRASADTIAITWTVAGVMPFALTRDFARRFDFAHLAVGRVVLLDFGTAVVQLSCLALLGLTGRMSALGACGALGIATVVPTAIWFYHSRAAFRFSRPQLRTTFKQTWALGKWLVVSRITGQIEQYITYWLAAVVGGPALTGAYAACMSIIGFANPLMIGLTNAYMPRLVLAWKQGGGRALMHEALRNAALIAALMIAFTITVSVAGEQVMAVLFQGKDFIDHGRTLVDRGITGDARHAGFGRTRCYGASSCDYCHNGTRSTNHIASCLDLAKAFRSARCCLRPIGGLCDWRERTLDRVLQARAETPRPLAGTFKSRNVSTALIRSRSNRAVVAVRLV